MDPEILFLICPAWDITHVKAAQPLQGLVDESENADTTKIVDIHLFFPYMYTCFAYEEMKEQKTEMTYRISASFYFFKP